MQYYIHYLSSKNTESKLKIVTWAEERGVQISFIFGFVLQLIKI